MLLWIFTFYLHANQAVSYCFTTDQETHGLPKEICLSSATWSITPDGSRIVNVNGPEIHAMMEEVLPTSKQVSAYSSYINRFEECGKNIQSQIFLEKLTRDKEIDLKKIALRLHIRYTEPICNAKWKTTNVRYYLDAKEKASR